MKRIKIFLLLFILYLFMPNNVFADSWLDEGNYNPNWNSKCDEVSCTNFDERDLAGAVYSAKHGTGGVDLHEVYFEHENLDFSDHKWVEIPANLRGLARGISTITLRFGDSFGTALTLPAGVTKKIVYRVPSIPEGLSLSKSEKLETGEEIIATVTPREGYTYTLTYSYANEGNGVIIENNSPTKIGDDTYKINVSIYNVLFHLNYTKITYPITYSLGDGVRIKSISNSSVGYHENKNIEFLISPYYVVTSCKVNGEMVDFTNNKLSLYGDKAYNIEINTIKKKNDNIIRKGTYTVDLTIDKKDPNGNFLNNCSFRLRDKNGYFQLNSVLMDNNKYLISYGDEENGAHKRVYNSELISPNLINNDYYLLYQLLYPRYQELIDSVKTYKDLDNLSSDLFVFINEDINKDGNEVVDYIFFYPLILEENKAPLGFKKEKRIIGVKVSLRFVFYLDEVETRVSDNSPLTEVLLDINSNDLSYILLDYNEELLNDNFNNYVHSLDYSSISICRASSSVQAKNLELNNYGEASGSSSSCLATIVDQYGTPKLKLTNTVNDKSNVSVTKNSKLDYKIVLKNTGTATSTNNVIVTEVPEGIEYVPDSASNNGVYDSINNTITWNLDSIDEGEEVEFRFSGIVSDDKIKTYIQNSYVSSTQLDRVDAKETVVKLLTNPVTFSGLILFLLTIGLIGIILVFGNQLIRDVK